MQVTLFLGEGLSDVFIALPAVTKHSAFKYKGANCDH